MRKRKLLIFSLATLTLIVITALLFWMQDKDSVFSVEFIVNDNQNEERISLHKEEDTFYAFLPAYANLENITISVNNNNKLFIDNELFDRETNIGMLKTNLIHTIEIKNLLGLTVNKEKLMILKSENIPTISLSLTNGIINDIDSSKSNKAEGIVRVIAENGDVNYSGVFKSIHGRGQASWSSLKKPYTLEFEDDVNILNLGNAKKWILLANAYDASNLKNKLIFEASKKLGMKYYCDSQFVDLYIDGDYRGLYLLSEKIEIGEDRIDIENLEEKTQQINYKKLSSYGAVEETNCANGCEFIRYYNIPDNPVDITGGYILKLEQQERILDDSFFVTEKGTCFDCESPKYASKEQIEYISDVLKKFENNLDNYDVLQQFVDINSCVNRYLIEECFANYESTSYYFIKDSDENDGKLYFEPVWDYDMALGNYKTTEPTGIYNTEGLFGNLINSNQAIQELVKTKFEEKMFDIMNDCEREIQQYYQLIRASDVMNKTRWKNVYGEASSLDIKVDNLINYINQRAEFLNRYWIEGEDYVTVSFSDPERVTSGYYRSKSVIRGDAVGQADPLTGNNYVFLGWFDKETGEKFDESKPILSDCKVIAKWQEKIEAEASDLSLQRVKNALRAIVKDYRRDEDTYYAYGVSAIMIFCFLLVIVRDISGNRKKVKHK